LHTRVFPKFILHFAALSNFPVQRCLCIGSTENFLQQTVFETFTISFIIFFNSSSDGIQICRMTIGLAFQPGITAPSSVSIPSSSLLVFIQNRALKQTNLPHFVPITLVALVVVFVFVLLAQGLSQAIVWVVLTARRKLQAAGRLFAEVIEKVPGTMKRGTGMNVFKGLGSGFTQLSRPVRQNNGTIRNRRSRGRCGHVPEKGIMTRTIP
jgi:hypothetical protein